MGLEKRINIIVDISKRAEEMNLLMFDRMSLIMDIQRVDEDMGLRLSDLLHADNFNFSHDIVGIQNNMNRETRKLNGRFLPRFKQIEKVIEK